MPLAENPSGTIYLNTLNKLCQDVFLLFLRIFLDLFLIPAN